MPTRQEDFQCLFNALWYRDFPVTENHIGFAKRADWTTHIASTIRQAAALTGMYSCFESGGRTDAELQFNDTSVWAKVEWEWDEPKEVRVGELRKLAKASGDCEVCVFIGYSQRRNHVANLQKIQEEWVGIDKPLVVFLITFEPEGGWRWFDTLETYTGTGGSLRLARAQPALPWNVPLSRWQSVAST